MFGSARNANPPIGIKSVMANKNKYTDRLNLKPYLIPHRAERLFALKLRREKKQYTYQPTVCTRTGIYHPDFYLIGDDVYVEIIGSRQAYHIAKRKIQLFHREYGEDKLLVLREDGTPYCPMPSKSQIDVVIEKIAKSREDNTEISPENIRELRVKLGLQRKEWAKIVGAKCYNSTLYWERNWERGGRKPGRRARKILLAIMKEHEIAKQCPHCNSIYFTKGEPK